MNDYDICTMIYQDIKEHVSTQYSPQILQIYEHLKHNDYTEAVIVVALLHQITGFIFPDMNERMCTQRGLDYSTSFSTSEQLIDFTSAEFAKERFNISSEIYKEILHFQDESYTSNIKTQVIQILELLRLK